MIRSALRVVAPSTVSLLVAVAMAAVACSSANDDASARSDDAGHGGTSAAGANNGSTTEPAADAGGDDDSLGDDDQLDDAGPFDDGGSFGSADSAPAPADGAADAGDASLPLLKAGLSPAASAALRAIGVPAGQIVQTIGYASASAGTHAPDGTINGLLYTAAVDLSVHGLSDDDIRALLAKLGSVGFAAWYRWPGHDGWPKSDAVHIHAVYAGVPMKLSLRDQIHDFCAGKNGLASHTIYTFYHAEQSAIDKVRALFLAVNPTNG